MEIGITSKEGNWQNLSKLCIPFEPQHYFQEDILQVPFHMWKGRMFKVIFEALFLIAMIENNLMFVKKGCLNNLLAHPNNGIQYHAAIKRKRYLFTEMERYIDMLKKTRCRTVCIRC